MKYLSIVVLLFLSLLARAQEPTYTPMKGNYKFKGIKVDTLFLVPSFSDTASANATKLDSIAGAMIRCGNDFYMRNASLNAWLQNVNVGNGASPVTQFVDTIYRKAGKDSIYWRKGGITRQFKDSTGQPDSPDRIDGKATNDVHADMDGYSLSFDNSGAVRVYGVNFGTSVDSVTLIASQQVKLQTDTIKLKSNNVITNLISAPNLGTDGSGKLIINTTSYETPASDGLDNIDLTSDFTATTAGTYTITTSGTGKIYLPNLALFKGRYFTFFNTTGNDADFDSGITIYVSASVSTITKVGTGKGVTITSDGLDWRTTWSD